MSARTFSLGPVQDAAFLWLTSAAGSLLGALATFVLARAWGPEVYGGWQALITLLWYATFIDFGVRLGIARDVPVALGEGDEARYRRVAGCVLAADGAFTVVTAAGLLAWSVLTTGDEAYRRGLGPAAAYLLAYAASRYMQAMLYAHQGLRLWAVINFGRAAGRAAAAVALFRGGFPAMLAAWCLIEAAAALAVRRADPSIRFHFSLDGPTMRRLLARGFPYFLLGLAEWQARIGDKAIAGLFLGEKALGYYGLATTVNSFLMLPAMQVGQAMYSRIMRRFGETKDPGALKTLVLEPCRGVGLFFPFLAGLFFWAAPTAIRRWLPAYEPSIPPLLILCGASVFLALIQTQGTFLLALDRTWTNLFIWSASILAGLGANGWLLSRGFGVSGVALASAAAWLVSFAGHFAVTLRYLMTRRESWSFVLELLAPSAYAAALVWAGRAAAGALALEPGAAALAGAAIFTLGYAPVLRVIFRRYRVMDSMREFFRRRPAPAAIVP